MENKEATQTCGKCHREVAEANFALHETHCSRFLSVCPDCDEAVPREQLSQHREEQHTQVRCSKCNKKMERCRLLDHESDECVERLQECQFCELEVPWKELREHSRACGSRTELCRDCGRYVKLQDLPGHGSACSAADGGSSPPQTVSSTPDTGKKPVICSRCVGSFSVEEMEQHEMECFPAAKFDCEEAEPKEEEEEEEGDDVRQGDTSQLIGAFKETSLTSTASRGPWGGGGDPDQISTCPHCHLALPVRTLRWHKAKCQTHIVLKYKET